MNKPTLPIDQIEGFIFDLDGTLYLGEQALPGAVETISGLRRLGKQVLFVSNKPLYPRSNYAAKLSRLGIPASVDEVVTSASVLGYHLAHTAPRLRLYVIGEENLKTELGEHGLHVLNEFHDQSPFEVINPHGVDAVVVAFDRTFDYRKLNTAYQALVQGAAFFATNPDKTCPMPGGGIPDAGATLAALKHLTGREPDVLAGKPSQLMMQVAMDCLGLPPDRCIMIGDRLETDIRMGKEAGMYAALVLTGATPRSALKNVTPAPDWVLESIKDLGV